MNSSELYDLLWANVGKVYLFVESECIETRCLEWECYLDLRVIFDFSLGPISNELLQALSFIDMG